MLFFITVSVLVVSANAVVFTDCGSSGATVQKVSVSGCAEDAELCVLQRKINITFSIEFTPNEEADYVSTRIHGRLLNHQNVQFLQSKYGVCMDSGLTCPLSVGQKVSHQLIAHIENLYPQITLPVTWKLLQNDDEDFICIMFTAKIE